MNSSRKGRETVGGEYEFLACKLALLLGRGKKETENAHVYNKRQTRRQPAEGKRKLSKEEIWG